MLLIEFIDLKRVSISTEIKLTMSMHKLQKKNINFKKFILNILSFCNFTRKTCRTHWQLNPLENDTLFKSNSRSEIEF